MEIGTGLMPLFAIVEYATPISRGVSSIVPNAIDGIFCRGLSMPRAFAVKIIFSMPVSCAIFTVDALSDFSIAVLNVTLP